MNTDPVNAPETPDAPPKRKRGRPRKNPLPPPEAPAAESPAPSPAPVEAVPSVPSVPVAPSASPASSAPVEAVPSVPSVPVAPSASPAPSAPLEAVPSVPSVPVAPSAPSAPPAPSALDDFSLPEPVAEPEGGRSLDAEMQARREAAMRMKRGIDDMSDSIAAMQAFFSKKTSTQTAMAQQAKSLANKAAKQAARAQAAKEAAVKAAAARLAEAAKPQPPPSFPGKVRVDRWGRPIVPQPAAAAPAQPARKAPPAPAAPAPAPVPANPDLPVLNILELQRCGASDLAALVDEAKLDDKAGTAFASRHDLVLALLAEHARRGGAVEGEGVYMPVKDVSGCLLSALNGLRRTPADVRVSASFAAANGLRPGDHVVCRAVQCSAAAGRGALQFEAADVVSVNGLSPEKARRKLPFDAFQPAVPARRIALGGAPGSWIAETDAAAPLAEGDRALAVFESGGTRVCAALAELAASVKAANAGLDVVLALFDPDPATVAAVAARAAADRDAGRAPAFEAVLQDPGDHQDRATTFTGALCDCLRRRAACGRRVALFTDLPGPVVAGFARAEPGDASLAPDASLEREVVDFRRLWGSARDLDGAGSLTVVAAVHPVSRYDGSVAARLLAGADWSARFAAGPGGAPAPVAGSAVSRHAASDLAAPAAGTAAGAVPEFRVPEFRAPDFGL